MTSPQPAAFAIEISWSAGAVTARCGLDERLRRRGHVSTEVTPRSTTIWFGMLLDRDALASRFGAAAPGPQDSDAAVAAMLYDVAGTAWLAEAAGDWAVVMIDHRSAEVHLARNHAGTRPVFFRRDGNTLFVASNIAATGADSSRLHDEAVALFLVGSPPEPGTCLAAEAETVRPAHVVTFTDRTSSSRRYWDPAGLPALPFRSIDEAAPALRRLVRQVTADHVVRGTGPVAVHLTGGLDSSSLAIWATEQRRAAGLADPLAYSWQPMPSGADEPTVDQRLITEVAVALGIEVRPRTAELPLARAALERDPAAEPVTSTLSLEYPVMVDAAAQGVELFVSGWGGDELASYNGRHRPRQVAKLRGFVGRVVRRQAKRATPGRSLGYASAELWQGRQRPVIPTRATARQQQIELLETGHLHERTDSWSAAAAPLGLQYAFPLLDRRVLEFVLGLPEACFPAGRVLYREALRGVVPESVRTNRDKTDPARSSHSEDTLRALVHELGVDIPLNPERLRYLDLDKLAAALRSEGPIAHPGKLLRALQLGCDPAGVPLSSVLPGSLVPSAVSASEAEPELR